MAQMNQNGGKRNGRRDRGNRVNTKGEQMELLFAEQQFGRDKKVICYLGDSTVIYPGTRRFKPKPGKKYLCDVRFVGQANKVGLARPVLPYTLSPEEWMPDSELRQVLVAELVFQKQSRNGQERLIAFDGGQAVFPDKGTEVSVGKRRPYMLRERGTVSFAVALPQEAQATGTGLVKLAEGLGEWSKADLGNIVLKIAENKDGVVMARSEEEVRVRSEYRSTYFILGVPENASRDDIRKAYKAKSLVLHPDRVLQSFSRNGQKPPLLMKMNATFFFEALTEAQEKALKALDRAEGGSKAAKAKTRADASTDATDKEQAPKSKRTSRKRKPRKAKTDEQAPKAETPVAETTTPAEEVPATEPANEEHVTEAAETMTSQEAAVEAMPTETSTKDGSSDRTTEDGDPIGSDGLVYGEYTPEAWAKVALAVKKFKRKYGNKPQGSSPSPRPSATVIKAAPTPVVKSAPKQDFREQLEQFKNESKS